MRSHADWMVEVDERILEFLDERGNHPPSAIRDQLAEIGSGMDYSSQHINNRCRKLRDHGLVTNVASGVYSITDTGRDFLTGDLDAGTLTTGTGD